MVKNRYDTEQVCGKLKLDGEVCAFKTNVISTMTNHRLYDPVHVAKKICSICQRSFSPKYISRHKHCTVCSKGFDNNNDYDNHLKQHATPRNGNSTYSFQIFYIIVYSKMLERAINKDKEILKEGARLANQVHEKFGITDEHERSSYYGYTILRPLPPKPLTFRDFIEHVVYPGHGQTGRVDQHNLSHAKLKVCG